MNMLSNTDLIALSPLLILLAGALFLLLFESFYPKKADRYSVFITLSTLAIAVYATLIAEPSKSPLLTPWLNFDSISRLFTLFFLFIGVATTLLAGSYFQKFKVSHGEFFFLLLSSIFGLIMIGQSADFLTLFLGLETLSISLYILCAYIKRWEKSHEAALKYFLLGALAASFLLYGIALIYGAVGTTRFSELLQAYKTINIPQDQYLFLIGVVFVTIGLIFKATIVPFHLWAPDVYEGASTPVTAFMAVGTKVGAYAALIRVFLGALHNFDPLWNEGISLLVYPTLIYANFVALRQTQLNRFFAYSGISHSGFLLIPLAVGAPDSFFAIIFYLIVYALATLGSFAVLVLLDTKKEGVFLTDLRGLFRKSPLLATVFSLCLLTLAGIPPTAGFFAKFYLFKIAYEASYYGLVVVALLTTILSAYYYLRIIAIMLAEIPDERSLPDRTWMATAVGSMAFALIILLSFFPTPFLELIGLVG